MKSSAKIGIIGSGIGGLAVGLRLAAKGYAVDIFEKSDKLGGKISQITKNDFRFDAGPSLFTLPELVDDLLNLSGKLNEKHFKYVSLDIICRYFFSNGVKIDAYQDTERFAREIEEKTGVAAKKVSHYLLQSEKIYDLTKDIFIFNDLKNLRNLMNFKTLSSLVQSWKLEPFRTLHETNQHSFGHPDVVQLFDRYATYNGSNPYKAPATLKVIPHLEHNIGAFFPEKGMYNIVETIREKAIQLGVKFHLSEEVKKIKIDKNKIVGLQSEKKSYAFDNVIADVDVFTFNRLMDRKTIPMKDKYQLSSSAIIFYWGMNIKSEKLLLHNILFSANYEQEFKHIFELKSITDDPTVYIFISSKMVKGDAPENCENWFVMINAPENVGQDWQKFMSQARMRILKKIQQSLGIDVEKHLLFEQFANPETIEKDTGSFHGSLYGLSSNNIWAAFRRHPNYLKSIKGLYFVGGSVHPGGGIPLCLASAQIVSRIFPDLNS